MRTIRNDHNAQQPDTRADFKVDSCAFHAGEFVEVEALDLDGSVIEYWPMVYILTNAKRRKAYVGETENLHVRLNQHRDNEEKSIFDRAHVIYNPEFNKSVVLDYEHQLIEYMAADSPYELTNKNEGHAKLNYFAKRDYDEMFKTLWQELRKHNLATKSLEEIENSSLFKYSPYKTLSMDQKAALDEILLRLSEHYDADAKVMQQSEPIVVEGMPGSGKTVLGIYLLKLLKDKYPHLTIKLVEPVTSLRKSIGEVLKTIPGLKKNDVMGPADIANPKYGYDEKKDKSFDIVLIDEAHKLSQRTNLGTAYGAYDHTCGKLGFVDAKGNADHEATQMDWIIRQTKLPIFFYDADQSIGPKCIDKTKLRDKLGASFEHPIKLFSEMRVEGGSDYINYVKDILSNRVKEKKTFPHYEVAIHTDFNEFSLAFEKTQQEHALCRMLAGYAWDWLTKSGKKDQEQPDYDFEIAGNALKWNSTLEDWVGAGFDDAAIAHEIGCIHSIQGYDLSYAYVIIGNDLQYDPSKGGVFGNKKEYKDKNGKATIPDSDVARITDYITNIYYVLLTRGIKGTHIYVCDPALREYMSQYFPIVDADGLFDTTNLESAVVASVDNALAVEKGLA